MTLRTVCLATGLIVAGISHAEAKVVDMGFHSRAEVESACAIAGARAFGIQDLEKDYGCKSEVADVSCTKNGLCRAFIGDTRPLTGNSLDHVLTYGKPIPPAQKILPKNSRIEAVNALERPVTSTGCYGLAYSSPGCAGEPPPR